MTAGPGSELSKLTPKQRALLERRMLEKHVAAGEADVIPRRLGDGATHLSFAQERLWVVEQIAPGSPAYHIADAFLIEGGLDVAALRRALEELTVRHESLRTTFAVVDGQPMQSVAAVGDVDFQEATIALPDDAFDDEVQRLLATESERPFDLERGPLLRVRVFHAGAGRHVLLLAMHHIVTDAWSRDVLFRELSALYDAFTSGQPSPLAELPIQYADYATWQRERLTGAVLDEQIAYWRGQLADIPTLQLPAARRRAAAARHGRGASAHAVLPKPLSRAIKELCRAENVTVSMLTLAALDILLQRYCGQDDVVVGSPVAGREREELNDLVGFFVNMLVMRTRLDGDPTVRELLARVRAVMLDAYEHQEIPFEKLVKELDPDRDLTRNPLFQVAFQYGRAAGTVLASTGLAIKPLGVDLRTTRFDFETHVAERDEDIHLSLIYDDYLFDASTMQGMLAHYRTLLEGLVADPARRISSLPLLEPAERDRILVDWNVTSTDYPRDATVPALFARQATQTPDAVALEFAADRVSYAELNRRANQVAHHLARRGAGPGTLVAICVDRSVDFIVGLLGILKCGAAYVPLDPQYPAPRLAAMLEETQAPVLLAHEAVRDDLPAHEAQTICLDRDWPAIATESDANPAWDGDAEDLAYVMYTSGSTGQPKGVCVPHRSIARLVLDTNYVDLQPADRIAQASNVSFDAATFEIWGALLNGAAVVGIEKDAMLSPTRFGGELRNRRISVLFITTALFNQLVEASPGVFASLRYLLFGGEAVDPSRVRAVLAHGAPERLLHVYGPTESTTYATWHEVTEVAEGATTVPIGRPLANTTMYILDRAMQPVPVGVPGELYLGGDGLAHGYLASPGLSADRFVPDPFGGQTAARLYRTGDLVRCRGDGAIEFVGRTDAQVKIRGFRIEPGEIEAALGRHDAVREAVVLCREDEPGEKRLVAYVVTEAEDLPAAELRGHLRETLPDYMIPAAFVRLESLPLTPNGKVNHRALPEPDRSRSGAAGDYVAPRGPVEERLAGIWSDVLRLEQVGVHDNFFELGGDSILSILVVSRVREAGLHLTPAQIFQHQTIAELAELARDAALPRRELETDAGIEAEQGVVTGEVQLTPIQHWIFEKSLADAHHFNQSVLMSLNTEISPEICREVVVALVEHHDALRLRFTRDESGRWTQRNAAPSRRDDELFTIIDLSGSGEADRTAAVEQVANELQASLDLESGPLMRVAMIDVGYGEPKRLLWIVHHLVVDGVSWRILLADFQRVCQQRLRGEAVHLPPKTMSFQQWAQRLSELARSDQLDSELDGWCDMSADDAAEIPVDHADGENTVEQERSLSFSLSVERTTQLLQEVPRAYHTRINDVLLTALVMAFGRWSGRPRLQFDMEGHGREPLLGREDVSRTIGWFTSLYPLVLHVDDPADTGGALKSVKEQLRSVPRQGLGYGVLRYLRPDDDRSAPLRAMRPSPISFNYLGQFDQQLGEESMFGTAPEPGGALMSPRNDRLHLLDVIGTVAGGQLHVGLYYSAAIHDDATVERFCKHLEDAVEQLIEHCTMPGAGGFTPSDFPLAGIDQTSLDLLVDEYGRESIEDLYPLTPMQQGIRFLTLRDAAEGVYVQQVRPRLSGLDAPAFREAWQRTVDHHPALRTSIVAPSGHEPMQLVHRRARLARSEHDLREKSAAEQAAWIDHFLREDLARGLDMAAPVPMRIALLRLDECEYECVWTFHHIALDGWSCGLVLKDVVACYFALTHGETASFAASPPFREYIEWLDKQDLVEAESFWRRRLAGLEAPTLLAPKPRAEVATAPGQPKYVEHESRLDPGATRRLNEFARERGITLNTLAVGAWALLMRQFTGEDVVAFGTIVSGRPAEIRSIEKMIGLTINTLPLCVSIPPDEPVSAWLRALQHDQNAQRSYEYSPLWQVQQWSQVPRGTPLFDTLFVFENYPVDRASARGWGELAVSWDRPTERTGYPLVVTVVPNDRLLIRLTYDRERFAHSQVDRLIRHYVLMLQHVAAEDPSRRVSELSLLDDAERHQILVEWNDTATACADDRCVHELFEAQAARTPDAVAVTCGSESLTYAELNARANRLAHLLQRHGVGPEVMVGIFVERGVEMLLGVLGVLKAGGAYVPLDPTHPEARTAYVLESAAVPVLLTQQRLRGELPNGAATVLCLDADPELADEPACNPAARAAPESLAYAIYTSGSTGRPKGVQISHRNVVAFLHAMRQKPGIVASDSLLAVTTLSFDIAALELFLPLCVGARVVIAPAEVAMDGHAIQQALREDDITVMQATPATWQMLVQTDWPGDPNLKVLCGGEALPQALADALVDRSGELWNMYGPTETTIWSSVSRVTREEGSVTIGRPIANERMYILNEALRPVPIGTVGELYIGGAGVARGYVGRPDLTAERFVPDPFGGGGGRLYQTGDLARFREDGSLEFLGRTDHQVKLRGYRIELGEIEVALLSHDAVRAAVVQPWSEGGETALLVGYIVLAEGATATVHVLKSYVAERLPRYMVPDVLMPLDSLPKTANGKLDRRALPPPQATRDDAVEYVAPESPMEEEPAELWLIQQELAEIWLEVLPVDRVGRHDSFFDLGGHSLLATQLVSRIRSSLAVELTLRSVFDVPTLDGMSREVLQLLLEHESGDKFV